MKKAMLPALILCAAAIPVAHAEGLAVEPGLWEMTTTVTMPMLPEPQTTTDKECVEDATLDVEDMNGDDLDPNCTVEVSQPDKQTLNWSMDCPVEGGEMHAKWTVTSGGDSLEGKGTMTMSVMGQEMAMDATMSGRRIGDCPAE